MNKKTKVTIIIITILIICVLFILSLYFAKHHNLLNMVLFDLPLKANKDMMTKEEVEVYNKYRSLIIKGDEEDIIELNNLFDINKNNILFKVYTDKYSCRYKESVVVRCEIQNIGKEKIIIFPLSVTKLSNVYVFNQSIKVDYKLSFDFTNQAYLKILEPDDIYQNEFTVKDDTLGKHIISISLSIPRIIKVEKRNLSIEYKVIDLKEISYRVN